MTILSILTVLYLAPYKDHLTVEETAFTDDHQVLSPHVPRRTVPALVQQFAMARVARVAAVAAAHAAVPRFTPPRSRIVLAAFAGAHRNLSWQPPHATAHNRILHPKIRHATVCVERQPQRGVRHHSTGHADVLPETVTVQTFAVDAAAKDPSEDVPPFRDASRPVRELGSREVLVRVLACGVCHTDFFLFGKQDAVPGHEVIGVIEAAGSDVSHYRVGQRVGCGYQTSSCGDCSECNDGYEPLCSEAQSYMQAPNGGFASHVTWDERFVFPIPDEISSPHAAPLLCAGATVYNAIYDSGVRPGDTIGVIGVGGLGHLALQFAKHWGCEVVALTTSPGKEEQCKALGASSVVVTTNDSAMKAASRSIDLLLSTVPGDLDWARYLRLVAPRGTASIVGIAPKPLEIPGGHLITRGVTFRGSLIAGRMRMRKMLEFAAQHGIRPQIECVPLDADGCREACRRVADNSVRFRAVLVADGCDGVE